MASIPRRRRQALLLEDYTTNLKEAQRLHTPPLFHIGMQKSNSVVRPRTGEGGHFPRVFCTSNGSQVGELKFFDLRARPVLGAFCFVLFGLTYTETPTRAPGTRFCFVYFVVNGVLMVQSWAP